MSKTAEFKTDLSALFKKQDQLDNYILAKHNLKAEDLKEKRELAFLDEVFELLNETRVHKYWSVKPMSDRDVLLEEYVDGWHFILMIGNDLKVPTTHYTMMVNDSLVKQFKMIMNVGVIIYSPIGWDLTTSLYKGLGAMLGFDWEKDIIPAYDRKYQINIERQEHDY